MATRILHRVCSPSSVLWHQRSTIQRHVYSRSFSSTTRTRSLQDVFLTPAVATLEGLHLALPWWAAIPASAVVVRGFVSYYTTGRKRHDRLVRLAALQPLMRANTSAINRLDAGKSPKLKKLSREQGMKELFWLWNKYDLLPWSALSNLAILLVMAEGIRVKLGASGGLLSILITFLSFVLDVKPHQLGFPPPPPKTHTPEMAAAGSNTMPVTSLDQIVESVGQLDQVESSQSLEGIELSSYDPTTTLEGLSFCTDLTAPDATGILPATLCVVMIANIVLRPRRAVPGVTPGMQWISSFNAADGFFILVAWVFYHMTLGLPAGIHLYLIANLIVGKVEAIWQYVRDPIPRLDATPRRKGKGLYYPHGPIE